MNKTSLHIFIHILQLKKFEGKSEESPNSLSKYRHAEIQDLWEMNFKISIN